MIQLPILTILSISGFLLSSPADAQAKQRPKPAEAKPMVDVATLGLATTALSAEEAILRKLKLEVRVRGQLVSKLQKDGPAAKAGILVGDVIEQLDDNGIYSEDDIADFLNVSKPKQVVTVHLARKKNDEKEKVRVALGSKRVEVPKKPRLEWDFASLGQLDDALAKAKKENRLVLVGLSGAET